MNAAICPSVASSASAETSTSGSPGTRSRSPDRISTRLIESIPRSASNSIPKLEHVGRVSGLVGHDLQHHCDQILRELRHGGDGPGQRDHLRCRHVRRRPRSRDAGRHVAVAVRRSWDWVKARNGCEPRSSARRRRRCDVGVGRASETRVRVEVGLVHPAQRLHAARVRPRHVLVQTIDPVGLQPVAWACGRRRRLRCPRRRKRRGTPRGCWRVSTDRRRSRQPEAVGVRRCTPAFDR